MLTTQDVCMLVQFLDALSPNSVPDCLFVAIVVPIFQISKETGVHQKKNASCSLDALDSVP